MDNINAGVKGGMNSSFLNKGEYSGEAAPPVPLGVAIHEIGHNFGGEHNDGTSVMDIIQGTTSTSHIGGTKTTSYSYPNMSNKFLKIIFNRRNPPKPDMWKGGLWTKKQ